MHFDFGHYDLDLTFNVNSNNLMSFIPTRLDGEFITMLAVEFEFTPQQRSFHEVNLDLMLLQFSLH